MNESILPQIEQFCDSYCAKCHLRHRCDFFISDFNRIFEEAKLEKTQENAQAVMEQIFEQKMTALDQTANITIQQVLSGQYEMKTDLENDLINLAFDYLMDSRIWISNNRSIMATKFISNIELGVSGAEEKLAGIADAVEAIFWYQFQIFIALQHSFELKDSLVQSENAENTEAQMNLNAKTAILAIQKSIAAWPIFEIDFPNYKTEIDYYLNKLEILLTKAKKVFPNGEAFIRPYFDD